MRSRSACTRAVASLSISWAIRSWRWRSPYPTATGRARNAISPISSELRTRRRRPVPLPLPRPPSPRTRIAPSPGAAGRSPSCGVERHQRGDVHRPYVVRASRGEQHPGHNDDGGDRNGAGLSEPGGPRSQATTTTSDHSNRRADQGSSCRPRRPRPRRPRPRRRRRPLPATRRLRSAEQEYVRSSLPWRGRCRGAAGPAVHAADPPASRVMCSDVPAPRARRWSTPSCS